MVEASADVVRRVSAGMQGGILRQVVEKDLEHEKNEDLFKAATRCQRSRARKRLNQSTSYFAGAADTERLAGGCFPALLAPFLLPTLRSPRPTLPLALPFPPVLTPAWEDPQL